MPDTSSHFTFYDEVFLTGGDQYFNHIFNLTSSFADSPKSTNEKENVGYNGVLKNGEGKEEAIYAP